MDSTLPRYLQNRIDEAGRYPSVNPEVTADFMAGKDHYNANRAPDEPYLRSCIIYDKPLYLTGEETPKGDYVLTVVPAEMIFESVDGKDTDPSEFPFLLMHIATQGQLSSMSRQILKEQLQFFRQVSQDPRRLLILADFSTTEMDIFTYSSAYIAAIINDFMNAKNVLLEVGIIPSKATAYLVSNLLNLASQIQHIRMNWPDYYAPPKFDVSGRPEEAAAKLIRRAALLLQEPSH